VARPKRYDSLSVTLFKTLGLVGEIYLDYRSSDLEAVFRACFEHRYQTKLIGGAAEPEYLPASLDEPFHRLYYRHDYFSSALHESAHWCIAGKERRKHIDFAYWYEPDNRSIDQQALFECVEAKPQALECLFSLATGMTFRPSVDNLMLDNRPSKNFVVAICDHLTDFVRGEPLPSRAQQFCDALIAQYGEYKNKHDYMKAVQAQIQSLKKQFTV